MIQTMPYYWGLHERFNMLPIEQCLGLVSTGTILHPESREVVLAIGTVLTAPVLLGLIDLGVDEVPVM